MIVQEKVDRIHTSKVFKTETNKTERNKNLAVVVPDLRSTSEKLLNSHFHSQCFRLR